jgi:cyclopropane fatty-acyl-phospholipid synthase-like methyltransferase
MKGYGAATYGDRWADVYDTWVRARLDAAGTQAMVDLLAELAAGGRVLELGIGTGRIALPLAERGLEVHGIDASEAMVAKLRAKPRGDAIPVTIGHFADVDVDGAFDLIFVVFNTIFALGSQEDQIRCFSNAAKHLTAQGLFVLEAFVPDVTRFDNGQALRALRVSADEVGFEASLHDPVTQTVKTQHVVVSEAGTRLQPVHIRYAWPTELDLMARLARLELRERWGGSDRAPFTASSGTHVSVYAGSS